MLFNILFVVDWRKIGERRQSLTNCGNQRENATPIDYNCKVGDKVLVINEGILHKAESAYGKEQWTITTVHTNGTIRIQRRTTMEQLRIWRVLKQYQRSLSFSPPTPLKPHLYSQKHHSLLPPSKSHDNPSNSSLLSTHHVQVPSIPQKKNTLPNQHLPLPY
jgi:hypothetical protein